MVSVGVIDKLGQYFISISGPIQHLPITQLVLGGLNLLVATTAFLHSRSALGEGVRGWGGGAPVWGVAPYRCHGVSKGIPILANTPKGVILLVFPHF